MMAPNKQSSDGLAMKVNGKLVYFLLSLLVAMTAYIGNGTINSMERVQGELKTLQESVQCLRGDFEGYRGIHEYKHEVLNDKLQALHGPGR
jgi:hypothetical protein